MAPQGVPPLAHAGGAPLAERPLRAHRLPGHHLLRRPQAEDGVGEPGRGRPRAAGDVRQARDLPRRARAPRRRGGGRHRRLGVGGHDVQGEAGRSRRHLLLLLRGRAEPSGPGAHLPRLGRPLPGQLLRHAQLRRVLRRLVLLRPQGRALPDGAFHLLPHQRRRHRPVRADPDRRRGGRVRELPRGLHRPDAGQEPAPRRGGRARRPRRRPDQVLHRAELVPGRRGGPRRHLQLRHQAGQVRRRATPRSPGPRSRPARPSPGSTRASSSRATTRSASSTPSPSPPTASRPTPAPR